MVESEVVWSGGLGKWLFAHSYIVTCARDTHISCLLHFIEDIVPKPKHTGKPFSAQEVNGNGITHTNTHSHHRAAQSTPIVPTFLSLILLFFV